MDPTSGGRGGDPGDFGGDGDFDAAVMGDGWEDILMTLMIL